MLFTYLEHTRRQSEETRKRKALFFTIVITGLIVIFYLLTLYFKTVGTRPTTQVQETQRENTTEGKFNAANVFLGETPVSRESSQKEQTTAPSNTETAGENPFGF